MKRTAIIASLTASLLVAGCNSEPEEAPDITEVIPLDEEADIASGSSASEDRSSTEPTENGDPNTLERGDNSDQPPIDLENSKLQPAD